jgi:hypothetical protein
VASGALGHLSDAPSKSPSGQNFLRDFGLKSVAAKYILPDSTRSWRVALARRGEGVPLYSLAGKRRTFPSKTTPMYVQPSKNCITLEPFPTIAAQ